MLTVKNVHFLNCAAAATIGSSHLSWHFKMLHVQDINNSSHLGSYVQNRWMWSEYKAILWTAIDKFVVKKCTVLVCVHLCLKKCGHVSQPAPPKQAVACHGPLECFFSAGSGRTSVIRIRPQPPAQKRGEQAILATTAASNGELIATAKKTENSLEMSSSWNFPARASPSYEGSEPSRGTSIFELKPSWNFFKP